MARPEIFLVGIAWFLFSCWRAVQVGRLSGIFSVLAIYTILIFVLRSILFDELSWESLGWVSISAGAGSFVGAMVALVLGFSQRSLPKELEVSISHARKLLPPAASANLSETSEGEDAPVILRQLNEVAHALIMGASETRTQLSFFQQGIGSAAWDRLQPIQRDFQFWVSKFIQHATRQATEAESSAYIDLWKSRSEHARELMQFVSDAMTALAARIGHYQSLTSLIVATAALVIAMMGVIIQLILPLGDR